MTKARTLVSVDDANGSDDLLPEFTQRFLRHTRDLKNYELMAVLRADPKTLAKLKNGDQVTLKLDQGLRLAARLGISPWEFVDEEEPSTSVQPSSALESRMSRLERKLDETIRILVQGELDEAAADRLAALQIQARESRAAAPGKPGNRRFRKSDGKGK